MPSSYTQPSILDHYEIYKDGIWFSVDYYAYFRHKGPKRLNGVQVKSPVKGIRNERNRKDK